VARPPREGEDPLSSLLEIRGLTVRYGDKTAVDDVTLAVESGDVLGVVGESGSGKTTLGNAVLGLLPANASVEGEIRFEGRDLGKLKPRERRRLRGGEISAVFQNPSTALDPAYTIGDQVAEVFRANRRISRSAARAEALRRLKAVGIPAAEERMKAYPHELSGGMNQRVALAIAMALDPTLLLADEPTSALDVTVQAQILRLFRELIAAHAGAVILISHDLGVVAQLSNRVAVMRDGAVVEEATVHDLYANPRHAYTRHLLSSLPGRRQAELAS
jgi:ABC-type dipeptide/oligopeptide/nickel transport system ATPase component